MAVEAEVKEVEQALAQIVHQIVPAVVEPHVKGIARMVVTLAVEGNAGIRVVAHALMFQQGVVAPCVLTLAHPIVTTHAQWLVAQAACRVA